MAPHTSWLAANSKISCNADDLVSNGPDTGEGLVCSIEIANLHAIAPSVTSVSTFEGVLPAPIVGFVASPRYQIPTVLRNLSNFFHAAKSAAPTVETLGGAATAFWSGVGALFGSAVGTVALGPAPALAALTAPPQGLDNRMEKIQRLLGHKEALLLTDYLATHPHAEPLVNEALRQDSPKMQLDALRQLIQLLNPWKNNVPGSTSADASTNPAAGSLANKNKPKSCPTDMVWVLKQESGLSKDLCVDPDHFPDPLYSTLPLVKASLAQASALCAARQARLPTKDEYVAVASFGGKKLFPTKDGTWRGIHFASSTGPRRLKYDPEDNFLEYTQPNGTKEKLYNLSGNAWHILANGMHAGGAWISREILKVEVSSMQGPFDPEDQAYSGVTGFRCVTNPK